MSMGSFIDCKYHLLFHVIQIWPNCVNGKIILCKFLKNLSQFVSSFISPSALVVSQAPERRNMGWSDVLMKSLEQFFGVLLSNKDDKVYRTSNWVIDEITGIFSDIYQQSKGIFEVDQVMKFIDIISSEVDGLKTISLITLTRQSSINFPRLISVPEGPFSINNLKIVLESLSQPPFLRVVDDPDSVVQTLESEVVQYKKRLLIFSPLER